MKYALHLAVVALSAAFACATPPAPTTYNQSALRPPPTPRFSPVEDAPHTFKPGRPRPSVEPGPKPTRVLPETPETRRGPGIWAGDEPKAGPQLLPVVGVVLPVPDVDEEDDLGFAPQCAGWLAEGVLDHPEFSKMLYDLPKNERLCVLLDTWGICLDALVATPESDGGKERAERLNVGTKRVKALTDYMLEKACKDHIDKTRPISSTMIGKLLKTLSRPHKPMLVH